MGSEGRRSAAYRRFGEYLKQERPPCAIASGPWCTGIGDTIDHDPPLSAFPHWRLWQGTWRGACKPCQDRQGGQLSQQVQGRGRPKSRVW